MIFRQLFDEVSSTFTYLIADAQSSQGIIIDPIEHKVEQYKQLLSELNINLKASLETHMHADHLSGSGLLKEQTGCQIMVGAQSNVQVPCERFNDGDTLQFGKLRIQTIHTPGHTDDSYCFLLNGFVFTGDTLLIRGTGRTDFQNGSAALQYESIQKKLFTLSDDTYVFPGHDYKGMTVSTIGEEKKWNPRLNNKNKNQYIELMDNLNLPYPKMIDKALAFNQNFCEGIVENKD